MRDNCVSIAKGIAIILMVWAHTEFSVSGCRWIAMFHMPLFFFFAGYCFNVKYIDSPKEFVKKRFLGLYVPYVKWGLIFLLLHNVFFKIGLYNTDFTYNGIPSILYDYKETSIRAIKIITVMSGHEQLLGGYWFFKTLLFASLMSFFLIKYIKKSYIVLLALIAITIIFSAFKLRVPYLGIEAKEFLASSFFVSGYIIKDRGGYNQVNLLISIISLFVVTIGSVCWSASMLDFNAWQVLPYFITALLGTTMIYYISTLINKSELLSKYFILIGENTLSVLTWHFLSFKIVNFVLIKVYLLPMTNLADFPVISTYSRAGWWLVYLIIGVLVPMMLSKVRYLR